MKPGTITARLPAGRKVRCSPGTPVGSLLEEPLDESGLPYIGCLVNNDVCSLTYRLDFNCSVVFITMEHPLGMRMYRDSLTFLLAKTVADLYPKARFMVQHSLGSGLYCMLEASRSAGTDKPALAKIDRRMREYVNAGIPIERRNLAFAEAIRIFKRNRQADKLDLLRFRNPQKVTMYVCDGFSDLAHAPLASSTSMLKYFALVPYSPGFVLQIPDRESPKRIRRFKDQPHLFNIFKEHKEWGRILGVSTVGKLNETIAGGRIRELIKISEALQEKKIAHIADQILARRNKVRLILLSGPSAAGKTTFSKRLAVQLRVNGIRTKGISLDNYYVNDEDNPRDRNGRPDYEHIDALDLKLLNRHLLALIKGKKVRMPRFNFNIKRREYTGKTVSIDKNEILIVEGIHGLNPALTQMIENRQKFRIYISALTQLNIDCNNRISTTDNRLMRRIVRDNTYRGNSALTSLRMWPSVRQGEKRWIFPHQARADATMNSALDYELAVLKPLIEPLLMQVKPTDPEYAEARRLERFLSFFLRITRDDVPHTSLLREFIGGSSFEY